jgi:hypothetical protein
MLDGSSTWGEVQQVEALHCFLHLPATEVYARPWLRVFCKLVHDGRESHSVQQNVALFSKPAVAITRHLMGMRQWFVSLKTLPVHDTCIIQFLYIWREVHRLSFLPLRMGSFCTGNDCTCKYASEKLPSGICWCSVVLLQVKADTDTSVPLQQ